MSEISINDADGAPPLAICRGHREWMVDRFKIEASIALRYFSDDLPVSEDDRATDESAARHIRKCPKCREWIHHIVPESVLQRQRRLTQYCCAGMFVAVEEADADTKNRIAFEFFRGEDPCWMIDGKYSFASYCPWCGSKLPGQPFIQPPRA